MPTVRTGKHIGRTLGWQRGSRPFALADWDDASGPRDRSKKNRLRRCDHQRTQQVAGQGNISMVPEEVQSSKGSRHPEPRVGTLMESDGLPYPPSGIQRLEESVGTARQSEE